MSPASPPDVGSTFSTSTTPAAWDLQPVQPVSTFSVTSTLIPPFNDMSIGSLLVPQSSWDAPSIGSTPLSPPMSEGSATFELTTDIWPLNIPPPATLHHLVETFFSSVPLASRLIHKPTFMASLRLVPTSATSLYSPIIQEWAREAAEDSDTTRPFNSGIVFRPDAEEGVQGDRYYPRKVEDVLGPKPNSFGAAHIQWAGETMKLATRHGDRLLQLLQAAVIVTWYHYSSGLVLGVYAWLASVSKFVVPLGLNVSEGFEPLSRLPPQMLFLFGKPKTAIEAETVRNVFWITYVMERLYTAGTVWSMSMSDEDVSQMMPCRSSDFMSGVSVPTRGRQRLFTNNMLLHHHSLTTDAWTLYIKATILVSKVRTFNGRYHLTPNARSSNAETTPTQTEVFLLLDQTIAAFPQHIPPAFRTPVDTTVDPLLYMAHLLPHVFCWFVAGAAIIRLLKVKMNLKDEAGVERLTQDLNVVKYVPWAAGNPAITNSHSLNHVNVSRRFVLGNLGDRTTIGLRQIQLLNELYEAEINSNFDRADYIYTPRRSADAEVQAAIVGDSL
ncbi:hypothetical protein FRC04_006222 [Tulasnella sp. 424]|nr:hypothetical protein FRC04_006222 [Tulasnella sp. 424]